jgi:hypothetical protein
MRLHIPSTLRIIVPVPVVIQPRLTVMVLARKAQVESRGVQSSNLATVIEDLRSRIILVPVLSESFSEQILFNYLIKITIH